MYKCKKCGKEFEGNFCPDCGEIREAITLCPKCATECKEGQRFCNFCGCKLLNDDLSAQSPEQQPAQPQEQEKPNVFKRLFKNLNGDNDLAQQENENERKRLESVEFYNNLKEPEVKIKLPASEEFELAMRSGVGYYLQQVLIFFMILPTIAFTIIGATLSIDRSFVIITSIFCIIILIFVEIDTGNEVLGRKLFAKRDSQPSFNIKQDVFLNSTISIIIIVVLIIMPAMCGVLSLAISTAFSGIFHSSIENMIFADGVVKNKIIIASIIYAIGIISAVIYIILKCKNAKKLKLMFYGNERAKFEDNPIRSLTVTDTAYLEYLQYLEDRKLYEIHSKRKEKGLPYKKISKFRLSIELDKISYMVVAIFLAVIIATSTILLSEGSFRYNATKLARIGEGTKAYAYAEESSVNVLLGEPDIKLENEWYYYEYSISNIYEKIEKTSKKLEKLSTEGKQDSDKYERLEKKQEKLFEKLLEEDRYWRIKVVFNERGNVEQIVYTKVTRLEELFGMQTKDIEFEKRGFKGDNLKYNVGDYYNNENWCIKTWYKDGSYTMVCVDFDENLIDTNTAGEYEIAWQDPLTGIQTAKVQVA